MVSKKEAAEAVRAARARLGVSWAQLADAVGQSVAWTTSALLGQHPMTATQAAAAASLLELGDDIRQALQMQPYRRADPAGDRVVIVLDGKFLPYQW
jgi:cyanate lyase